MMQLKLLCAEGGQRLNCGCWCWAGQVELHASLRVRVAVSHGRARARVPLSRGATRERGVGAHGHVLTSSAV
eukprot:732350-Prymnesium_polylepis.1